VGCVDNAANKAPLATELGQARREGKTPIIGAAGLAAAVAGIARTPSSHPSLGAPYGGDGPGAMSSAFPDELRGLGQKIMDSGAAAPLPQPEDDINLNQCMAPISLGQKLYALITACVMRIWHDDPENLAAAQIPWSKAGEKCQRLWDIVADDFVTPHIREAEAWREDCQRAMRDDEHHCRQLDTIAGMFGPAIHLADDGSFQDSVLRAKLPEIVRDRLFRTMLDEQCMARFVQELGKYAHHVHLHGTETMNVPKIIAMAIGILRNMEQSITNLHESRDTKRRQRDEARQQVRGLQNALTAMVKALLGFTDDDKFIDVPPATAIDLARKANQNHANLVRRIAEQETTNTALTLRVVELEGYGATPLVDKLMKLFPGNPGSQPGVMFDRQQWIVAHISGLVGQYESMGQAHRTLLDVVHRIGMCVIGTRTQADVRSVETYEPQAVLQAVTHLAEQKARQQETIREMANQLDAANQRIKELEQANEKQQAMLKCSAICAGHLGVTQDECPVCLAIEHKGNYEKACQTVAAMHAELFGKVIGPKHCPVGDVKEFRRLVLRLCEDRRGAYVDEFLAFAEVTCTCLHGEGGFALDENCPQHGRMATWTGSPAPTSIPPAVKRVCNCHQQMVTNPVAPWEHATDCPAFRNKGQD
jgi:hypothetical protein